jgi:hypothetical protein
MPDTYKSQLEADEDRDQLLVLMRALNAAKNSLRRDECRAWIIQGRGPCHIATRNASFAIYLQCSSPRAWTWAKKRLAFCTPVQDGDDDGILLLGRLPSVDEAAEIRALTGIRQTRDAGASAEFLASIRRR